MYITSTGLSVTIKTLRYGILQSRKSAPLWRLLFNPLLSVMVLLKSLSTFQHKLLIAVSSSRVFLDMLPGLNLLTTFQQDSIVPFDSLSFNSVHLLFLSHSLVDLSMFLKLLS